jgi:uncharacterized lipoprotein
MKKTIVALILVLAVSMLSGCISENPRTERAARRIERRDQNIQGNLEGIPEDVETFWLNTEPQPLSRWEH